LTGLLLRVMQFDADGCWAEAIGNDEVAVNQKWLKSRNSEIGEIGNQSGIRSRKSEMPDYKVP